MFTVIALLHLAIRSAAIPFAGVTGDNSTLAEPFAIAGAYRGLSRVPDFANGIFRRQGCPNLSLACPSGTCCSYATSVSICCGRNCCAQGYLCTGGTQSNPCCVAINSPTNQCGSVNPNSNPCQTDGYLPCNGLNFCCPPSSRCYYDSAGNPRCAPLSTSSSRTTRTTSSYSTSATTTRTTSSYSTSASSRSTTTSVRSTTSSTSRTTSSSTTTSRRSQPTPINNVVIPYNYPPSASEYLPWTWYVTSSKTDAVCPSAGKTLVTFALVNIVVAILSMILCHKRVVKFWSLGVCGGDYSNMWRWSWIIPLGLQLGANAIIATIYKNTPGYEEGFTIADLFLFWTTRPRLSWLVLTAVIGVGADAIDEKNGHWESAAKSAMIAEGILLLLSTYYMGWTANFARAAGFYSLNSTASGDAKLMYAGALMSLIFIFGTLVYLGTMIVIKHDWENFGKVFLLLMFIATTTWLASWLFWVGYIYTAGNLYCPPKLAASGSIWAAFSLIGNMLGGGGA